MDIVDVLLLGGLGAAVYAILNATQVPGALDAAADEGRTMIDFAGDTVIDAIAQAIATAEGFYVPGSVPQRAHNPGDLVAPWLGLPSMGPEGITVFPTVEEGWAALKNQVRLMFSGSRIYNPSMTIAQVGAKYTRTEQTAWAHNVAGALGVTPDTTLADLASARG